MSENSTNFKEKQNIKNLKKCVDKCPLVMYNQFCSEARVLLRTRKCVHSSAGQSNGLLSRGSGVRIPLGTLNILDKVCSLYGGYSAVGQRARLWLWRPRVRIPLSTLLRQQHNVGLSPSGKAQGFDPCTRWFESSQPSFFGRVPHKRINMEHQLSRQST